VHPHAQIAAEAAEAAGAQDGFWEMHDQLIDHQRELTEADLGHYAEELGLDLEKFWSALRNRVYAPRVSEDVASADASGVAGTPTFFINGLRHHGAYDVATLTQAVRRARQLATLREHHAAQG
jgi:protein-disulfide isomerase